MYLNAALQAYSYCVFNTELHSFICSSSTSGHIYNPIINSHSTYLICICPICLCPLLISAYVPNRYLPALPLSLPYPSLSSFVVQCTIIPSLSLSHTHTHTHIHIHTLTCTNACAHTLAHTKHTCAHTLSHADTCTHMHTHTDTFTHMRTCTIKISRSKPPVLLPLPKQAKV